MDNLKTPPDAHLLLFVTLMQLRFKILPDDYAVAKLAVAPTAWSLENAKARLSKGVALFSLSLTDEEISLVCPETALPDATECSHVQRDWRALRIEGTLDFALVGILARVSSALAARGISIFALSTFNTDYILVTRASYETACAALRQDGHAVTE